MAVSRERYDAQIYTNDKNQLVEGLCRDVSDRAATDVRRRAVTSKRESPELARERERTQSYSIDRKL